MLKVKHNSNNVFAIIVFSYLFLLFMLPDYTKLISIAIIIVSVAYLFWKNPRILLTYQSIAWLIYIVLSMFSLLYSGTTLNNVLEFCASIIIGLLFYFWDSRKDSQYPQIKALFIMAIISFLGCLLQLTLPDVLKTFNMSHLTPEKYASFDMFYRGGYLAGFSFQTAVTGFYLSILVGIVFCSFLSGVKTQGKIKKIANCVLLIFGYIFLFFTGKRSFILITIVAALVIIGICYKKHVTKIIGISTLMVLGLALLLFCTEFGNEILKKSLGDSWSTGRTRIYEAMLNNFMDNPILGKGIGTSLNIVEGFTNGHNIYLQILSESGIIGFFILIPIFVQDLRSSLKLLNYKVKHKKNVFIVSICIFIELLFIGWGMSGNPLYDVYPLIVYMLVSGIVRNEIKNKATSSVDQTLLESGV